MSDDATGLTTERRDATSVSVSRVIAADAATIFDVVADPARHGEIDGSGTVRSSAEGNPVRLGPGDRFGMSMKLGVPYRISNEVVEYEKDRLLAWRHFGRHVWRYEFEPMDGNRTRVTETFDWGPAPIKLYYSATGFPERNLKAIRATLERLAAVVEKR